MGDRLKVCALMSTFNEADIVDESIGSLVDQGIDVFAIDNGSTDGTRDKLDSWIGRGVLGVEELRFYENSREVYNWSGILHAKERAATVLPYDWFLHVDADEIRYSPWIEIPLLEGIEKVHNEGFNLINFKVFNFQLVTDGDGSKYQPRIEDKLTKYLNAAPYDSVQVKAWKRSSEIDLKNSGGHFAKIADPKVYPIRFILKHYPLRTPEQAIKKIFKDRKERFSECERKRGWHVQYDSYISHSDVLKNLEHINKSDAKTYSHQEVCNALQDEANWILGTACQLDEIKLVHGSWKEFIIYWVGRISENTLDPKKYLSVLQWLTAVGDRIGIDYKRHPLILNLCDNANCDPTGMQMLLSLARINYLRGNSNLFDSLAEIS